MRSTSANPAPEQALAVDLGGTWLRVAVVRRPATILIARRIPTPAKGAPGPVIAAIVELAAALQAEAGLQASRAGVAAPGPLDPVSGTVYQVPNLSGWDAVPLSARLQEQLGMPVLLHNDANLAGLAEARCGAGRDCDPLLYLTLSTGIGGAVLLGGRLLEGRHGLAGELGHVVVQDGGPACNFGHRGCLEALASGTAIARQARERLAAGEASLLQQLGQSGEEISARLVAEAAAQGDPLATAVLSTAGRALGVALAGFANIFDPARIVLGGGVSASLGLLRAEIDLAMAELVMAKSQRQVDVVSSMLEDNAGLIGAAIYAFEAEAAGH